MRICGALALVLLATACDQKGGKKEASSTTEGTDKKYEMLGVYPDRWTCELLVSEADVGTALGATATVAPGRKSGSKYVPGPCSYNVSAGGDAGAAVAWFFDVDCREDYEKRAETLFGQYVQQNDDLVEAYNKANAEGKTKTDAGVMKAPEDSAQVELGRRALDHHGQGLVFIDDDAPCYVRVVGPGTPQRLALGTLIAERLHEKNAPMEPHLPPRKK